MIPQPKIVTKPVAEQTLVERLRYRAAIRRRIRAEGDRLARDLDAAADRIESHEREPLPTDERHPDEHGHWDVQDIRALLHERDHWRALARRHPA